MQVLDVNGCATQLANRWSLSHVICSYAAPPADDGEG